MENNFEKALREAAKKFRIFIAISLFIRLLFSPIFFIFYLIKNLCERVFDFCMEIKNCFLKSFIKPIKKYRRFKRSANEENLNKKIEFQKFREEQFGKKWDGKMDGWREFIGYFFKLTFMENITNSSGTTREIKFRAYNKHTKKMYEVEGLSFRHNLLIVSANEDWERKQKLSDFELMQYTGLKDQEGKEIYEGDIITTTVLHQSVPKGTTMVIVWDDTELCFFAEYIQHLNQKGYRRLRVTANKKFKIIGNIYENPDLITNKFNK